MNEVSSINGPYVVPAVAERQPANEPPQASTDYRTPKDEVEISEIGALMAKVRELPDVREEKVAQIQAEIEAGTYETPERLAGTIDRLLEDLT